MPYLISFSPLMSSILKQFYLQEDFKVFWNTICRKDAKYKLYFLDLPAFVILHEHAHICSISKQQVFSKVLLPLVRNDHITQQCQSQVLSKASLAKVWWFPVLNSPALRCWLWLFQIPPKPNSDLHLPKRTTLQFILCVVSPQLFSGSRVLSQAR